MSSSGAFGLDRHLWFDLCHLPHLGHCACEFLFDLSIKTWIKAWTTDKRKELITLQRIHFLC